MIWGVGRGGEKENWEEGGGMAGSLCMSRNKTTVNGLDIWDAQKSNPNTCPGLSHCHALPKF